MDNFEVPVRRVRMPVVKHNRTIMYVLIIATVVLIIAMISVTAILWFFDITPFNHVQPSDPKFKYPYGKYSAASKNVMSDEAKANIQKNIDALKPATA